MITSVHTLIYSNDPAATRAFFKDVLRWGFVSEAAGPDADDPSNWLIFNSGPSELGVHPTGEFAPKPQHQVTLMCDDLESTMADLESRGAEFTGEPTDAGFGRIVDVKVPGTDPIMIYQPLHPTAYDLD